MEGKQGEVQQEGDEEEEEERKGKQGEGEEQEGGQRRRQGQREGGGGEVEGKRGGQGWCGRWRVRRRMLMWRLRGRQLLPGGAVDLRSARWVEFRGGVVVVWGGGGVVHTCIGILTSSSSSCRLVTLCHTCSTACT